MHYHAHAWGGTQVDQYAGGATPSSTLCPPNGALTQTQWDDRDILDERYCHTFKTVDTQCKARKAHGTDHCIFHLRQMERTKQASDGAVA